MLTREMVLDILPVLTVPLNKEDYTDFANCLDRLDKQDKLSGNCTFPENWGEQDVFMLMRICKDKNNPSCDDTIYADNQYLEDTETHHEYGQRFVSPEAFRYILNSLKDEDDPTLMEYAEKYCLDVKKIGQYVHELYLLKPEMKS